MSYIRFEKINKLFGTNHVLKDIDLDVEKGQLVTLLGPSGCGKSTLLRCLAGLEQVTSGHIYLDGQEITDVIPRRRGIGMVFQQYSLFPNMNVRDNVAYGIKKKKLPKAGLSDKISQYPAQLSGGQQQRVALARAMVTAPKVLLLDEPLSAIDALLRKNLQIEIRRIQQQLGITTIFVTHDQDEAMSISDVIVVMKKGVVQQVDQPQKVYDDPANLFVAKFLGTPPINVLNGEVKGGMLYIGEDAVMPVPKAPEGKVTVGIRPEGFVLDENGPFCCRLSGVEVMGRDVSVLATHEASANPVVRAIISAESKLDEQAETIRYSLKPRKLFLFHPETEERIRYED